MRVIASINATAISRGRRPPYRVPSSQYAPATAASALNRMWNNSEKIALSYSQLYVALTISNAAAKAQNTRAPLRHCLRPSRSKRARTGSAESYFPEGGNRSPLVCTLLHHHRAGQPPKASRWKSSFELCSPQPWHAATRSNAPSNV